MATAPIENTESGNEVAPRDFEADAKKMGWSPIDEFKGDPTKHIDAETFVTRGEELMPFLKAHNRKLQAQVANLERGNRQFGEFHTQALSREYERAKAEILADIDAAVESGDSAAGRKAADKLEALKKPPEAEAEVANPDDAAEQFADWGRENKWYATNEIMRTYAEAQAGKLLRSGMQPGPEHLASITAAVKAKFPEEFEETSAEPAPRRRSAVDGGNATPPRRGGKTFNDLPPEAQQACDRFIKMGMMKDRESYVKTYQF